METVALVTWLIRLISGAVGGNVAGAVMKDKSLGTVGNSLAGILGGGIGGWVLGLLNLAVTQGGLSPAAVLSNLASGGIGGAIMLVIVAIIKGLMNKSTA